jgi:hypothetical protein
MSEPDKEITEAQRRSATDDVWHVWINRRQDERRARGEEWERSLYEFKGMLGELRRLPHWIKRARTGDLPTVHQHCSRSPVERIPTNRLVCALGVDVTQCEILKSLRSTFDEERRRPYYGERIGEDEVDRVSAAVCCWHIFTSAIGDGPWIDTSEGYVQDESDRLFWQRTYELMAMDGDEEPQP